MKIQGIIIRVNKLVGKSANHNKYFYFTEIWKYKYSNYFKNRERGRSKLHILFIVPNKLMHSEQLFCTVNEKRFTLGLAKSQNA